MVTPTVDQLIRLSSLWQVGRCVVAPEIHEQGADPETSAGHEGETRKKKAGAQEYIAELLVY